MPLLKIDADGFSRADFAAILDFYQSGSRTIWGKDLYLGPDSQEGDFLGLMASKVDECFKAAEGAYSSHSPATAIGEGLSRNVKTNGIARRVATNSLVDLRIIGQQGTTINAGVVEDSNRRRWAFIDTAIVIDASGEITKTAQCEDLGAIQAPAGTITKIATPTRGWQTVTNDAAATPGIAVESDGELRLRQSESTMLPSRSVMEDVVGAVASIPGVKRHRGYENTTNVTDDDGVPGHTIAIVAEGGDADAIARTIHRIKTAGTGTFARDADHFNGSGAEDLAKSQAIEDRVAPLPGGTTITVVDQKGVPTDINFIRPTLVAIKVQVTIGALPNFVDTTADEIKNLVAGYVGGSEAGYIADRLRELGLPTVGLPIGEDVYTGRLFTPVNLDNVLRGLTYFATEILIAKADEALDSTPIVLAFNEVAILDPADVDVVLA